MTDPGCTVTLTTCRDRHVIEAGGEQEAGFVDMLAGSVTSTAG